MYWSVLFGATAGALIWAALQLPAERARVIAWTLFLFAGQSTVFAYAGVAYADYAVMAVVTVALCLALGRVVRGMDLSGRDAAALGALFLIGMRSKETSLPSLALVGLFFIDPSGRLRFDHTSTRLVCAWAAGATVALFALFALDGLLLGDPLFSIRPWAWRAVLDVQHTPETRGDGPGIFAWTPRGSYVSLGLYVVAGFWWARRERDRRLLLVFAFPALFMLMLVVFAISAPTPTRYAIPTLPILCLLTALAFVRVTGEWRDTPTKPLRLAARLATLRDHCGGLRPARARRRRTCQI